MRACPCSAAPALVMTAVFASKALMPRKSRRAAPRTESALHVLPPSVVRNTCPALHPTQTTISFTALKLRQADVDATACFSHFAPSLLNIRRSPPAVGG